ncbi:hypothetical protein AVEN_269557-1 [Araneus ventricosus]|uniref:Uncharacterized protein n=1 Tax=Araneus ventricosus TaxID=182803 RepID=A0A4Y2CDW9_ARAVE|nr:hypothetical protein AVEN_269557-1 [Araneus ventricosus]
MNRLVLPSYECFNRFVDYVEKCVGILLASCLYFMACKALNSYGSRIAKEGEIMLCHRRGTGRRGQMPESSCVRYEPNEFWYFKCVIIAKSSKTSTNHLPPDQGCVR